jgi:hypothetical protein
MTTRECVVTGGGHTTTLAAEVVPILEVVPLPYLSFISICLEIYFQILHKNILKFLFTKEALDETN